MADLVLPDGTEINFDLRAISTREYLGLFDGREAEDSSDQVLAKAAGIDHEKLLAMPFEDYKRILSAFFKKANAPLDSPNLQSAPTSP
jgi:hypothetical protein